MKDSEIKQAAKDIFVNPTVAQRIVNIATSNKPKGWSHRSQAPYYKRVYADELKPFVDQMINDKQDIVYRYSTWCNERTGMSPNTVYNRVNQSIRYLIECMDTDDHKYAKWYESVQVFRKRDVGVVISYIVSHGDNSIKPEMVEPEVSKPLWERKMYEWIEDENNYEPFIKENLSLTEEDIVAIKIKISRIPTIQSSITTDRVALIRTV